ncbi:MAG: glycosyltransferase [Bacteroidales bacterium]|nr:glycosyltransferase [Bacteroidales bacterium]
MNKPLVSIFCVSYNHEQFIAQALDGFVMQKTNFDYEIVISDDCSTDNTKSIINEYIQKHPKLFKDVSPRKNLGMQKNWLHTLSECTGKYIALCEGDDYWTDADKLQKQLDFMEQHEDCALTYHPVEIINNEKLNRTYPYDAPIDVASTSDVIMFHFIPTCSVMFTAKSVEKLPPWLKKARSFDIALEMIVSLFGKIAYISDLMAVYRQHMGGISKSKVHQHKGALSQLYILQKFNIYTHYSFNDSIRTKMKKITSYHLKLRNQYGKRLYSFITRCKLFRYHIYATDVHTCKEIRHEFYTYMIPELYTKFKA